MATLPDSFSMPVPANIAAVWNMGGKPGYFICLAVTGACSAGTVRKSTQYPATGAIRRKGLGDKAIQGVNPWADHSR